MSNSDDQEDQPQQDDEYESDCEDYEDYKPEGYHPVYLNENFMNGRYVALQKLGWGHFSTVWLAEDKHFGQPDSNSHFKYVAMKIQKSKESYSESAADEIKILKALREAKKKQEWEDMRKELQLKGMNLAEDDTFCIEIINNFPHFGMHGKHACSTFQIMGPNLLDIIRFFEKKYDSGIPIKIVKKITIQLLIGLDFMHRMGQVIHTDLKPENVMVDLPAENMEQFIHELKLIQKKPLSMKFLKNVSQSSKNKKKKKKKKASQADKSDAQKTLPPESPNLGFSESSENESVKSAPPKSSLPQTEATETASSFQPNFKKKEEPTESTQPATNSEFQEELLPHHTADFTEDSNAMMDQEKNPGQIVNELDPAPLPEPCSDAEKMQESVEIIETPQPHKPDCSAEHQVEGDFSREEDQTSEASSESSSGPSGRKSQESGEYVFYWKDKVKIVLNEDIKIKIVDFGNACWTFKHFTDNIQTREYRSPEAILGAKYDANTDIWSLACMVFELLTGDYLFRPQSDREEPRDELHMALFISTLGKLPKKVALEGKYARELFNKDGRLRHTSIPEDYQMDEILVKEYDFDPKDALEVKNFLAPMLQYEIDKRISAREALSHPWLWT